MKKYLCIKNIKGQPYYYVQYTWREKLDPKDKGSHRGSGKSRVKSKSKYVGTVEDVIKKLEEAKTPIDALALEFGFIGAAYSVALEIGLVDLLKKYINGNRYGIPRWLFFFLTIINRLQSSTSKEKMGTWSEKTVLPDLLNFNSKKLNSKNFWQVTDDVINEKELKKKRQENPDLEDELFTGIEDKIFQNIENELFLNVYRNLKLDSNILLYDTTNFFTYIKEPARSLLARNGKSKENRNHLKQIGLALCVEKEWGIPLFYRLYRGNSHDSKTFGGLIEEMITNLNAGFETVKDLVLVLDKGNNSKENFKVLKEKIKWVGSLVLSHYSDLENLSLEEYKNNFQGLQYYKCRREVMGIECNLVLTYNESLKTRQETTLNNGVEKLKKKIEKKWSEYKRIPKRVPEGIKAIIKENHYGKFIKVLFRKGKPIITLNKDVIEEHQKNFGKNLLFSSDTDAESSWIITQYKLKNKIEDDFKLIKDPDLIRWRPVRHWTDTKIRAFGFCCIMSLVLIKVMQLKAHRVGLQMSIPVLKEELIDLKHVAMIYDDKTVEVKVTGGSSIQKRLKEIFNLYPLEKQLTLH